MNNILQYSDSSSDCDLSDTEGKTSVGHAETVLPSTLTSEDQINVGKHGSSEMKCDFLGLDNTSSDSESDSSQDTVELGTLKRCAEIACSSQRAKLMKKSDEIAEKSGAKQNIHSEESMKLPSSSFWTDNQNDDFTNPQVWGSSSNTRADIRVQGKSERSATSLVSYGSETRTTGVKTKGSRPLTKSCYYMHHYTAPHFTSSSHTPCSLPRKTIFESTQHTSAICRTEWCTPQFSHLLLTVSLDSTAKIWNVFSKVDPCVQTFGQHRKGIKQGVWSHCGKKVLTASYDKTARVFDVEQGVQLHEYGHNSFVTCVSFHPVHHHTFICGSLNCLKAFDSRTKSKPVRTFNYKESFGQVQDVLLYPDGHTMISCSDLVSRDSADRNIMAWDFLSGVVISNQIYQERYTCTRLKRHPTEAQILAQTQGDYIALFSAIKPYKMHKGKRFESHKVQGYGIGFDISPDGRWVASGSADGAAYFYDYNHGRKIKTVPSCGQCIDVAWHPLLPSTVAVANSSGQVCVWQ